MVGPNGYDDAEWKEYRPRIEPDGRSFQDELVKVTGTRKQLMERLAKLFAEWSPHDWTDRWNTHARHLTYATFLDSEMCISTDFSAQYEHKAFCTRTCEHPSRSNMDVFVVTHSPRVVVRPPMISHHLLMISTPSPCRRPCPHARSCSRPTPLTSPSGLPRAGTPKPT